MLRNKTNQLAFPIVSDNFKIHVNISLWSHIVFQKSFIMECLPAGLKGRIAAETYQILESENFPERPVMRVVKPYISSGNLQFVKKVLEARRYENFDDMIYEALKFAAERGKADIVKYLQMKGADVNRVWVSLLQRWRPSLRTMEILLNAGADINSTDQDGNTALVLAIDRRHFKFAQFLLSHGADVNLYNIKGSSPLSTAAMEGNIDCLNDLLAAGTDVNGRNDSGSTPSLQRTVPHIV